MIDISRLSEGWQLGACPARCLLGSPETPSNEEQSASTFSDLAVFLSPYEGEKKQRWLMANIGSPQALCIATTHVAIGCLCNILLWAQSMATDLQVASERCNEWDYLVFQSQSRV